MAGIISWNLKIKNPEHLSKAVSRCWIVSKAVVRFRQGITNLKRKMLWSGKRSKILKIVSSLLEWVFFISFRHRLSYCPKLLSHNYYSQVNWMMLGYNVEVATCCILSYTRSLQPLKKPKFQNQQIQNPNSTTISLKCNGEHRRLKAHEVRLVP